MPFVQEPERAPFDFGLPSPSDDVQPVQFASRRELRAAQERELERLSSDAPRALKARVAEKPKRPSRRSRRVAIPVNAFRTPVKRERKNPLSVIVTMLTVAGLFGVAGLPAYATNTVDQAGSGSDVAPGQPKQTVEAQTLAVDASAAIAAPIRDGYSATSLEDLAQMSRDALRAAQNAAYLESGARALGDDYPWPYELTANQGGGLSPLNYFYRECVDFVAWRLNRDAGSYAAPFKYVWSNLTPTGGNGGQWKYAWEQNGWPISDVPIAGAVAYVGGNHVAYVKEVLGEGYVLLEEYNYVPHAYSQRVILASEINSFLYPPPR